MNRNFKLYLISFFASSCLLIVMYFKAFEMQLGSPVNAEWWLKPSLQYKEHYARQLPDNRNLIMGGSNSLFGIQSEVIEAFTKRPTANLSLHAGIDLSFFYYLAEEHLRKGDLLVIALEFEHYFQDEPSSSLSAWFALNMTSWGYESYLAKSTSYEYLKVITSYNPVDVWNGLLAIGSPSKINHSANQNIQDVLKQNAKSSPVFFKDYSHKSLDKRGDFIANFPAKDNVIELAGETYSTDKATINKSTIKNMKRIKDLASERNARVVFTWPSTTRNTGFDLAIPEHQARLNILENSLAAHGLEIDCEPGLFNLDRRFFYDTKYHLNAKGGKIRSIALGDCLRSILAGKPSPALGYALASKKIKELESRF